MSYQLSYTGQQSNEALTIALEQEQNIKNISSIENSISVNANQITILNNNISTLTNKINNLISTTELCKLLYPINSIYTAASGINPNTLFPGTTWEKIEYNTIAKNYVNTYFGTTDLDIITMSDNSKWIPLVLQDNAGTNLFNSTTALQSNVQGKISNLYILNKTHDILKDSAGYYEFYLEFSDCQQRWKQKSNPITTSNAVTDYMAVSVSTTGNSWGGLNKSTQTSSCFLDGTPGNTNWHYAVCNYSNYSGGTPGAAGTSTYCQLYIRVPSLEQSNILANDLNLLSYLGTTYWKRVS